MNLRQLKLLEELKIEQEKCDNDIHEAVSNLAQKHGVSNNYLLALYDGEE
ncbi:hypothetical protein [Halobacteriovorax sp. CON-3]